jgi:hypothetical protein
MRELAAAVILVAVCWTSAAAQAYRASMRGTVTGPSGKALQGVEIRVMNERTRESRRARTDHHGRFTLAEMPPGVYRLTIAQPGYGRYIARTELAMNQDSWLDITLQAGNAIQASDAAPPFHPSDHDTAALHTFITDRDLNEWPIDGGNFLELALLSPDTAPAPQGSPTSRHGRFAMNAVGARDDFNNFVLDGVYNLDPSSNTPVVRPSSEAIRQFQVFTSSYDASFGHSAAAQVSAVTKSGTNAFAGGLYGFVRGTALGGRNHFAPQDGPAPEYSRSQGGGTVGGPLVKDRAFFFVDYEHTHLREGVTRVTNVPTVAERNGDFSQSLFNKPVDYTTGQRFPGDAIPPDRLSFFGRAAAALYPVPNRNTSFENYVSSPVLRDDIDQTDARVDHGFGASARLSARYSFTDRRLFEPFGVDGAALVSGFGTSVATRGQNVSVDLTHAARSGFVNDVRVGYTRSSQQTSPESGAGLSLMTVVGYSSLGYDDEARESTLDTLQISDTATFSHGHHTVRFGGEWFGVDRSTSPEGISAGVLTFGGQNSTGNALADLLLGLFPGRHGAPSGYPAKLETNSGAVFVQNDWRPVPTLSVSAGVRYEYATPASDPQNGAQLYDPAAHGLVQAGIEDMPPGGYVTDTNNIAPRVGFAWTVGTERMNVIRGGYGVYYNQPTLASSGLLYANDRSALANIFPPLGLVFIPPPAVGYQRDLQTPRMDTWNINLQHQLGQSRSFEFGYVGSRGHNLLAGRDINQPQASPNRPNPRPNPLFADITMLESRARSEYNALHIRFQQRPATGTSMLLSYTVGKTIDDASGFLPTAGDPNYPQNSLDPGAERGRASFDVRHRFSAAITRPLPFNSGQFLGGLGIVSRALADSDLEAVLTFQSGRPFTVAILPGIDNSNTGSSRFGFGTNDRPNVSGDATPSRGTESEWFNTAAFSMPPFGSFGNSGRNTLTGPGYKSINVAIVKHVRLGTRDRATIDLRLEAFNLLSTVNYDLPDAFFGSPTFGRILSAGSPRRVQFGVKAIF